MAILDDDSFDLLAGVIELTVDGYLSQSRRKLIDCFTWLLYRLPKLEYFVVHILLWREVRVELFLGGFIVISRVGVSKISWVSRPAW